MDSSNSSQIAIIQQWLKTGSINIFGMPFAGKDTVASKLADQLGATVVGGGDILRNIEGEDSVKAEIDKGNLAPTDDYRRIILPYLSQASLKGKSIILSAVGRWSGEEVVVLEAAKQAGHPIQAVVYIKISETTMKQRRAKAAELQDRGDRVDDSEESLELRLQEFQNKTLPVLDYYRQKGLLLEVDGELSRSEVFAQVIEKLANRASTTQ